MRNYEVAIIASPDLDDQAVQQLEEKVAGWIAAVEGNAYDVERWGRRRLAYAIDGHRDGYYLFFQTQMPPQASGSIERDLKLNEDILRFMITLKEDV
jgi:small subunit ribosomal protein S6